MDDNDLTKKTPAELKRILANAKRRAEIGALEEERTKAAELAREVEAEQKRRGLE